MFGICRRYTLTSPLMADFLFGDFTLTFTPLLLTSSTTDKNAQLQTLLVCGGFPNRPFSLFYPFFFNCAWLWSNLRENGRFARTKGHDELCFYRSNKQADTHHWIRLLLFFAWATARWGAMLFLYSVIHA